MMNKLYMNVVKGLLVLSNVADSISAEHDIIIISINNPLSEMETKILNELGFFESEEYDGSWCIFV